ncbi:unnamed protein product [Toxocara canis]|uniref:HCO3_cotransp domain-containing protein n=1 Tax=Toxocara canis TaxID=6265 RepID=A0A183VGP1_TOXCA|nr:unnamed protein product [Toxocara canis]
MSAAGTREPPSGISKRDLFRLSHACGLLAHEMWGDIAFVSFFHTLEDQLELLIVLFTTRFTAHAWPVVFYVMNTLWEQSTAEA